MQKFGKTIITNAGRQMLTQVDGAKGKITYTKASLCTQDVKKLSEDDCLALTALTGVQMDTSLEVTDVRDNTVTVLASFNNANVTKDLTFNSIGWFAKTSVDDTEKLLAVTPSETEQTLVAGKNGASTSSTDIEMVFARSHDTTVVVNPSSVGLVSKAQLSSATDKINNDINSLSALTNPSSIVSNQTINLDTLTTKGITKFQNAQLSSAGYMQAFDQSTIGLNGWIFNIYSNNGASYIQIVHITNTAYNQGAMYFLRAKANGTSTEDFARMSTVKDHAQFFSLTEKDAKDVVARDENKSFNPNNVVDSGVHRISSTKINAKYDVTDPKDANSGYSFSGFYWGWLFNLNFDDSPNSNAVYQLLVVNSGIYYREISVKTNDFPAFNSFSFAKDIAKLQTAIDNAGSVKTVDGKNPDDKGNIDISSLQNPDGVFTKNDTLDIDTFLKPGIYSLKDPTVIASINPKALDAVPANRDGKTRCGYLIIVQHDIYNVSQEIRIFNSTSYTVSHRFLFATNNFRPDFERIITTKDYQNIIGYIDGKETVHQCDDLTSGIAYSKANPNIIVATP